jgi:hypothetical protein
MIGYRFRSYPFRLCDRDLGIVFVSFGAVRIVSLLFSRRAWQGCIDQGDKSNFVSSCFIYTFSFLNT